MEYLIIVIFIAVVAFIYFLFRNKSASTVNQPNVFPSTWRVIITNHVSFYRQLNETQKQDFEKDIFDFLNEVEIEGVETDITITDKLLVASSAVIPVFGFPEWNYRFLDTVLLYPSSFDRNFNLGSKEEFITGMVGNGPMEGKVILSKPALHVGFSNDKDKKNVGIHEFIHLIDKQDGAIDGILTILNENQYAIPWLELIRRKTFDIIHDDVKDIHPYGTTNQQEFLAVTGEYFFERPHLLKEKHPELYDLLSQAFQLDTTTIISKKEMIKPKIERNAPCICGSGEKYKHCCLEKN